MFFFSFAVKAEYMLINGTLTPHLLQYITDMHMTVTA